MITTLNGEHFVMLSHYVVYLKLAYIIYTSIKNKNKLKNKAL